MAQQLTFNKNWQPGSLDAVSGSPDAGYTPYDYDYSKAFSGMDGLTGARLNQDGTYNLYRGGDSRTNDYQTTATIGADGTVNIGDWQERNLKGTGQMLGEFGLGTLALGTGLGALGQGPLAGMFGGMGAGASTMNPALIDSALGTSGYGASSAGLGGGIAAGGATALNTAATNPALIDSALGTSGYGASSAGLGGGAGTGLTGMFSNVVNGIKSIPGAGKMGVVSNLLGSVLGKGSGGISTLGNLGSLFSNYNQYSNNQDLINEIKSIYKPEGEYAKYLGEQLGRRDAAAGRNSQYGPRLSELMGRLGDSQARALSGLGGYMNNQQGGLNGMIGAGSRLFDSMGGMGGLANLFKGGSSDLSTDGALGPNAGPQMPTEDLDIWDLFGD